MLTVKAPSTRRRLAYAVGDAAVWVAAFVTAGVLRSETPSLNAPLGWLLLGGAIAALLQLAFGWLTGLYRGRYPFGSFGEVGVLALTMGLVTCLTGPAAILLNGAHGLPRSLGLLALPIALCLAFGYRFVLRTLHDRGRHKRHDRKATLLFGAGYLGSVTAQRLKTDDNSDFFPVAFIDDDPAKNGMRIHGVRVAGPLEQLEKVARETDAEAMVLCVNEMDSEQLQAVTEAAARLGLETLSLPPLNDILRGKSQIQDLRNVSIEDILGRRPVDLDLESIKETIAGKRVLVTGAGGSIGAELCRQVHRFEPSELIMLDRDETGLQQTQISITGHGLLDSRDLVLADIRDPQTMNELMLARRPDVVFHAAALKHLPLLERYPEEGWKSNVLGTLNVLRAAMAADVPTFVNISTDKAADPTSYLGKSKRYAEYLTAWAGATSTDRRYMSVRFGNVIGSRGSMLPTFQSMIERGGPLTVTDPEVTRFFMTIPEACQLVLQAGAIGRPGEVMVLDMGEPVKILDVAKRMIKMSGRDVEIVFTGLREGEKLHEDLIGTKEIGDRPFHSKIFHAEVQPMDPETLDYRSWLDSGERAIGENQRSAPHTPFASDGVRDTDADHAETQERP